MALRGSPYHEPFSSSSRGEQAQGPAGRLPGGWLAGRDFQPGG
jgi:hypothetical protein